MLSLKAISVFAKLKIGERNDFDKSSVVFTLSLSSSSSSNFFMPLAFGLEGL